MFELIVLFTIVLYSLFSKKKPYELNETLLFLNVLFFPKFIANPSPLDTTMESRTVKFPEAVVSSAIP